MTTDNIIDLLIIACSGLLVWSIAVTLTLWNERKEREPKATATDSDSVTPTEIPENDKGWHIRTWLVERLRADIVGSLADSGECTVAVTKEGYHLTHGEAHALLLPFLKKGYYAYRELTGWTGDKVTSFRVTKHRDAEYNALEITEELLTKNVQL